MSDLGKQADAWRRLLSARPVRNAAVDVEPGEPVGLLITVTRNRPWYFRPPLSWVLRPSLRKTIVLDEVGAQIWDLCDGQRNVEDIIDEFSQAHRLSFHEARVAATNYVKSLVQRGALAVAVQ